MHHRVGRALDEIIRRKLAAVAVKIIAQPSVQRPKFALGDLVQDVRMRPEPGRRVYGNAPSDLATPVTIEG